MWFDVEIRSCGDPKALYRALNRYGLNVMDLDGKVYIYGDIEEKYWNRILNICTKYGDIES